jgi:branched-chain amino acid transport system ATP-binding protein/nonpolar-amino-acid-transporting ATPase
MSAIPTQTPILDVQALGHGFGGLRVLQSVNLQAAPGRITGLIGPNGSGKTTCFNLISGFLRPQHGLVRIQGRDITACSVQARSRLGLVRTFQTPQVFGHMSVLDNLKVGGHQRTCSGWLGGMWRTPAARREEAELTQRAVDTARKFGLTPLLSARAGALPAGQQRIVELARACLGEPCLLLLDEPSSGLSAGEVDLLRDWIVALNAEGLSLLLVSHDMGLMNVAHAVNVLSFGEVICSGSMDEVRADSRVRTAYLGV